MFTAALFPSYSQQGPLAGCGARSHCGGSVTEHGLRGGGCGGLQRFWIPGSRAQAQQLWQMGLTALWHVGSYQNRDQTSLQHWQANSSPKDPISISDNTFLHFCSKIFEWTWTWANSRRWWGTGKPGLLQSMGSQRIGYNLATEQQEVRYF